MWGLGIPSTVHRLQRTITEAAARGLEPGGPSRGHDAWVVDFAKLSGLDRGASVARPTAVVGDREDVDYIVSE